MQSHGFCCAPSQISGMSRADGPKARSGYVAGWDSRCAAIAVISDARDSALPVSGFGHLSSFKSGALCGIFLHQAGALLFTFNQGAFSHHFALNGTLKQLRSASASSTLFVSILILISMPRN